LYYNQLSSITTLTEDEMIIREKMETSQKEVSIILNKLKSVKQTFDKDDLKLKAAISLSYPFVVKLKDHLTNIFFTIDEKLRLDSVGNNISTDEKVIISELNDFCLHSMTASNQMLNFIEGLSEF